MSDIKYIIAGEGGDEDGEHTRLGCLAMVRYAVAAVVTVLTVTVIALSIHAVLRSEDMGLSVSKGYIGADALWGETVPPPPPRRPLVAAATSKSPVPAAAAKGNPSPGSLNNKVLGEPATGTAATPLKLSRRRRGREVAPNDESEVNIGAASSGQVEHGITGGESALPKDCLFGCSGGVEPTQVTYSKASRTNLRVILIASNPGGRTRIDCNGTRVSLVDIYAPYGQIGDVTLDNFTVPPLTTVRLQKRLKNTNTSYIWQYYHLASRFSVRVVVTSMVTSYPLGKKGKTVQQNYTCQPVTVGLIDREAIYAGDHVHCT